MCPAFRTVTDVLHYVLLWTPLTPALPGLLLHNADRSYNDSLSTGQTSPENGMGGLG